MSEEDKRLDEETGQYTTGHKYDGIEELNTPLPKWWLWTFYATIVWGIAYTIAYPAWPLVSGATAGVLGYSSRGEVAQDIEAHEAKNAALVGFPLQYLMLAAAFQLVDGMQAVSLGALRGLQDTRVPMWIAVFSYWVPGFGLAIGLGFYTPLEGIGVWIGLATGLLFAAILLTWRWSQREALGLTAQAS